jgi:hypothetical protein
MHAFQLIAALRSETYGLRIEWAPTRVVAAVSACRSVAPANDDGEGACATLVVSNRSSSNSTLPRCGLYSAPTLALKHSCVLENIRSTFRKLSISCPKLGLVVLTDAAAGLSGFEYKFWRPSTLSRMRNSALPLGEAMVLWYPVHS